jgi:hypothetical protein
MFEEVLSKKAKQSLALLGESDLLKDAYLAGGTALALQIGHRVSVDFDFFTSKEFNEKILLQRIQKQLPEFQIEKIAWRTILGYIKATRFSLFFYEYPLLFATHKFLGVNIADIKDIAPMKIASIADRGTKRDFIDLYFIIAIEQILTLEEALKLYDKKFKVLQQNKIHILKSLVYFEDAEKDIMPRMIKTVDWRMVKKFFEKEVKDLSKKLLTS